MFQIKVIDPSEINIVLRTHFVWSVVFEKYDNVRSELHEKYSLQGGPVRVKIIFFFQISIVYPLSPPAGT
jgi:hypothetical protein